MKRGQIVIVVVFIVLVVVLALSFYFYYSGGIIFTGKSVERKVTLTEKGSLSDDLIVPEQLTVLATIGKTSNQEFVVTNYHGSEVYVGCKFPPFQESVPSSSCYTYDADGVFVGQGDVGIPSGKKQVFTAAVTPFNNKRITQGTTSIIVDIKEGDYQGQIELTAWSEKNGERDVSVAVIPVKIFVEK
ncbi:MAG: hypothetical protein KKD18_01455 [Nanoarchaeota archaeon]|nr:hypothetical protein [Nanoarchaeota archaeon]MBU0977059.1 hypothetical protein [Nanoarchaeota archaeon]